MFPTEKVIAESTEYTENGKEVIINRYKLGWKEFVFLPYKVSDEEAGIGGLGED